MQNKRDAVTTEIEPPSTGYTRQWLRCRTCSDVSYYDYVPYSLSNPVTWTRCGHSIGHRGLNCDRISEQDALAAIGSSPPEMTDAEYLISLMEQTYA